MLTRQPTQLHTSGVSEVSLSPSAMAAAIESTIGCSSKSRRVDGRAWNRRPRAR
jgi:hypothetical protein